MNGDTVVKIPRNGSAVEQGCGRWKLDQLCGMFSCNEDLLQRDHFVTHHGSAG
jgi:hypothetical protein